MYDLASLTKILATFPLVMELDEKEVLNFDTKLGELIPSFKDSNKKNIRLQDMLMHYAKLQAWIPFYISTLDPKTKQLSEFITVMFLQKISILRWRIRCILEKILEIL